MERTDVKKKMIMIGVILALLLAMLLCPFYSSMFLIMKGVYNPLTIIWTCIKMMAYNATAIWKILIRNVDDATTLTELFYDRKFDEFDKEIGL